MFNRAFPTAAVAMVIAACSYDLPTGIKPSSTPATIVIQSGDAQTSVVARALANPLVARVSDARGRPVRNASVWFDVAGGGGIVGPTSMLTDSAGLARAIWRLGTSTAAEQLVRAHVTTSGRPTALNVTFRATPLSDAAWFVEIPTSDDAIDPAPDFTRTLVAHVYDFFRNPAPGATVRWSAPMAGTFDADETITGPDGTTANQWTVRAITGSTLGDGAYWITAAVAGTVVAGPAALYRITVGDARLTAMSLAAGGLHSCAVADAGQLYCWGDNSSGQLGDGDGVRASRPYAVRVSAGTASFTQVVAGGAYSCALTTEGMTYCWGTNSEGQLGDGTQALRSEPVAVEQRAAFVSLVAGRAHTCGLTDAGIAYCWGSNLSGQLGDGSTTRRPVPNEVTGGARFASLTAGADHTCGLTTDGRALCWGNNDAGQVGTDAVGDACRASCVTTPALLEGSFTGLSAGVQHTCGIAREGTTWCWGGHLQSRTKVESNVPFTELVGGRASDACGITDEGRAYCWTFYYDDYYYYGDGTSELTQPQPVGGARTFSALRLGDSQACGLERGEPAWVVCWSALEPQRAVGPTEPTYILRAGRP
jgi:hypothetical protein